MRILGFDPSLTNYGWAVINMTEQGEKRCEARGRFKTPASMLYINRYVSMRQDVRALIRDVKPDHMGIEFPVFDNLFSEGMYGLFLYTSEAIREERQDVVFWSPLQVKAHARESLGRPAKWEMKKPDMVEAARVDAGNKGNWNHNEADAYMVACLAGRFWQLHDGLLTEESLTPVERKYFLDVKRYVRGKKAGKEEKKGVMYREDERFFMWSEDDDGSRSSSGEDEGTG